MRNLRSTDIQFDQTRDAYVLASRPTLTFKRCTEFVASFFEPFNAREVAERLTAKHSNYRDRTPHSVLMEWERKRRDGQRVHAEVTQYIQKGHPPTMSKSRRAVEWLQREYPREMHEFDAELIVYNEELALAGTIDLLLRRKSGDHCILIDWKTDSSIADKPYNNKRGIRGPARTWDDCDYVKYTLQVSLYRFLFEKHYGLVVDGQFLVHLTDTSAKVLPCEYMNRKVEQMLSFAG